MRYLIYFFLAAFALPACADGFYLGPYLGKGTLTIEERFAIADHSDSVDSLDLGVSGGYVFSNHIVLETGLSAAFADNIFEAFDSYDLYQYQMLIGYSIPLFDRLNIIPKFGYAHWRLNAEEGRLFNAGAEMESKLYGEDAIWVVDVEVPLNKRFRLHLSYTNTDLYFGRYESTKIGFTIHF